MKMDSKLAIALRRRRARQRGLTLIETAVAMGIVALMLASLGGMVAQNNQSIKARAAALQLQQVTNAASQYIQTNYGQVLNNTPVGSVSYIPTAPSTPGGAQPAGTAGMQSLQAAGFLSNAFVDSNPYGQQTALLVTQPATAPGRLEAMVVTHGGRTIADDELGRIATSVGASGGFMPKNPTSTSGGAGQILGAYGGWRSSATNWASNSGGITPTSGHAMATLAFQNGALLQDFLYRHDIGNPDANSMYTDLHMQGNKINGVSSLCGGSSQLGCAGMQIDMNNDSITDLATIKAAGNNLALTGSLTASGDVTATGNLKSSGGYVQAGDLPLDIDRNNPGNNKPAVPVSGGGYFSSEVKIGGDTTVNGDGFFNQSVSVESDMVAGGKLVGNERIVSPRINSYDNLLAEIAPASASTFSMLNPRMLNLDTYVFGSSVNKPVSATNPLNLDTNGKTQEQIFQAVDQATDAFYTEAYQKYGQAGNTAVRLGDILPRYVLQRIYLLSADGATYTSIDQNTGLPTTTTIPLTGTSSAPSAQLPWPSCPSGVPEMYLSRVDESQSYDLPVTTSAGIVGVTGSAQGPTALYPMTGQTVQSVVTDVQSGGVNFAPNAQVTVDNLNKNWLVLMTAFGATGGEMVQGTHGATQTVHRRLMAQVFCHFFN